MARQHTESAGQALHRVPEPHTIGTGQLELHWLT